MAETLLALTSAIGTQVGAATTALSAIAPSASTLSAIGTGLTAAGTVYGGVQAQAGADAEAKQLKAKGDEDLAIGQRRAMQAKREKELTQSRIRAVSAASGGGADDDSITNLMEGVEQQGDYNSMLELYQGRASQGKLYASAANRRAEGDSALTGSFLGAAGRGASSIYGRYRS